MLPFIKPIDVKEHFEDEEIHTYNDALKLIIKKKKVDEKKVNILIAHQFVTAGTSNPETCESETINVLLEAQDIPVSEDLIFMKALDDCWLANIYLARGEITKANHYIDSGINLFLSQDIEAAYPKAKMAFYREVATFYQESRQLNQFRLYSELAKHMKKNKDCE